MRVNQSQDLVVYFAAVSSSGSKKGFGRRTRSRAGGLDKLGGCVFRRRICDRVVSDRAAETLGAVRRAAQAKQVGASVGRWVRSKVRYSLRYRSMTPIPRDCAPVDSCDRGPTARLLERVGMERRGNATVAERGDWDQHRLAQVQVGTSDRVRRNWVQHAQWQPCRQRGRTAEQSPGHLQVQGCRGAHSPASRARPGRDKGPGLAHELKF